MIQEKILVVEDDIQIQNFMIYTLENAGFEVTAVPSGKEANGKHMVYKRGREIHLTPMEYNLLYLFMRNPGKVLTYHTILQKIWGDGYGVDTQVLRSVMASTRRKIENHPAKRSIY